jgi:cell fate (sporulation/competence/biofilm development) regulator YlbF (YheA/YmcA/DUF963 family)
VGNIYDHAYDLEKAIRNTEEYTKLKQAYAAVKKDASAKRMFESFRQLQVRLQEKGMRGEQITIQETNQIQSQMQTAQQNPLISRLMMAEQRLSVLLNDVNKIMSRPLEELYEN